MGVKRRFWTQNELERLRELYPSTPTARLAGWIGRSLSSTYRAARKLGLTKTPEYMASGEGGRLRKGETRPGMEKNWFKKGQAPHNKGVRRPGYSPGRMGETQFCPGNRTGKAALNWRPIGTILVDHEGYQRIKVREAVHGQEYTGFANTRVWPLRHRWLWQQTNGEIPRGHIVAFKDGNRANCQIENLELITRGELARRNGMWGNMPRELAEVIQLAGALKRRIRRMQDGEKHPQ